MKKQYLQLPWKEPGWLDQAVAWIHTQLAAHGWLATGKVHMVHQRPWSIFMHIATDKGTAYFKAPAPPFYEAKLTQALLQWRPDCTVPLLAVDLDRGWLLSADAGATFRSLNQPAEQINHWLKALPLFAELQIQMADRVPEILALGVPDRRLANLENLYADLLEGNENLRVGLDQGLEPYEFERLHVMQPQFADWCGELCSFGLPETLTHEEIHENNVLVKGDRYIFTDWSDSSITHPFFSMLVTLRATAFWLKRAEDGPEIQRMRDAYLEPWTEFTTREKLLNALKLAYHLAMVNRALSWNEGTGSLTEQEKEEYADCVPGWLQDFLKF